MQNIKDSIRNKIKNYHKLYKLGKYILSGDYYKLNPLYYLKQAYYFKKYGDNLRLNIGAGPNVKTEGWLVLDYMKSGWAKFDNSNIDINEDVSKGIPLRNESVKAIYTSHFLEHLTWWEGMLFLKQSFRILRGGGE